MTFTYSLKARIVEPWLLSTPFGLPVVPEVNIKSAISSEVKLFAVNMACSVDITEPVSRKSSRLQFPPVSGLALFL